jgi:predicted metal-dependent hydrolase
MTDLPVDVIRSRRRRRTAQAYISDGRLRVMVPEGLSPEEESQLVETMTRRVMRKLRSTEVDLGRRAKELARRYDLPTPTSIDWSDRQMRRWGSCSPAEGRIRISNRLAAMPGWVLDAVLIHEMAHLEVDDHGPRFRDMVDRYELAERAKGYLLARSEEISPPR